MSVFTMVVAIVAIGTFGGILREHLRAKRAAEGSAHDEALDDALDRIDELEERVRVLERVITDDGYDLKRQIDSLKD